MLRVLAIVITMAGLITFAEGQGSGNHLIVKDSPLDVAETTKRLQNSIANAGATVFATVDHQQGAEAAGADLTEARVIVFGNPKAGTSLLRQNILIGVDLPMKILVWNDDGQTRMAYTRPGELATRYGIDPQHEAVNAMADTMDLLTDKMVDETAVNMHYAK